MPRKRPRAPSVFMICLQQTYEIYTGFKSTGPQAAAQQYEQRQVI